MYINQNIYSKADTEFINNLYLEAHIGSYCETKDFQRIIIYLVFNICELISPDVIGSMVHDFSKSFFFQKIEKVFTSKYVIKFYLCSGKTIEVLNGKNKKN